MSNTGDLAPGMLVTPAIRLVRLLGRGGMGSVWTAEHLRLHTQVVVKFMAAEYAHSEEAVRRFEREATLAAQAKSPHVVQVFDHGVSELGLLYIAMELLEGEDLAKRIERDGCIDPVTFANWLMQACRGLTRAHGKGIVHRDIKPENIFLCDNDGEVLVKVLDFGIAKGESGPSGFSGTRTGAFLGTAYYMSPEQTMGQKDLDHRSDLWSLGVVSFLALTGTRPFDGEAIGPLVMSITQLPIPTASSRNPRLDAGIDAWLARALARDRAIRFQSAKEMAEALAVAVRARSSALPGELPYAATAQHAAAPLQPGQLQSPSATASQVHARSGSVEARSAAGLNASTMAPSVRTDPHSTDLGPPVVPKRSSAGIVAALGAGLLVAVAAAGFAFLKLRPTAEPATSASAVAVAAAPTPTPSPPIPAPAPEPLAPALASAAPAPSVSAAPAEPSKPAVNAAVSRAHGVVERKATAAAPAAAPTAAPAPASAPAPAPVAAPAAAAPKPAVTAPKPAATTKNPLNMQMQ